MTELFGSPSERTETTILHELDLGQHTLLIMQDHSIDIVDFEGSAPYLADNGIRLDSDEAYRLFSSLYDLFVNPVHRHNIKSFPLTVCSEA